MVYLCKFLEIGVFAYLEQVLLLALNLLFDF